MWVSVPGKITVSWNENPMPSFFSNTRRLSQFAVFTSCSVPITSLIFLTIIGSSSKLQNTGARSFSAQDVGHTALNDFKAACEQLVFDRERRQQLEHFVVGA